jgi:hypothetical protein
VGSVKRLVFVLVIGVLVAVSAPGIASAKKASATDFAVGTGSTPTFQNFDFSVSSGPLGENPTGHSAVDVPAFPEHFESSSITCVSITGNTATFGGTLEPNNQGFTGFLTTVVDNGPANSGLDTYGAQPAAGGPTVCTPVAAQQPVTNGDVVVSDCVNFKDKGDKSKCKDK